MKKFIVIYHASMEALVKMGSMTPEEQAEGMKPWMAWKDLLGDKLIDFGSPLMNGTKLIPDGSSEPSKKEVTGYSIIQAENMDQAKELLKNHPHLSWDGACEIEVHEAVDM